MPLQLLFLSLLLLAVALYNKPPAFLKSAPETPAVTAEARPAQKTTQKTTAPPAAQQPAKQTKMVYMYSTTWCGVCKAARRDLSAAGVRFTEFFVDRDKGRRRELDKRLEKAGIPPGTVGVPIFFIGDKMLRGYGSPEKIREAAL